MSGRAAGLEVAVRVRRRELTVTAQFTAADGEIVAVMGPSGAGKTTLLEAIAGLVPLADGSVAVGGIEVATPRRQVAPQRRGTVLLRQDPCLFPHLNARENIAFGLRTRGASRAEARRAADEWLARVELAGRGDRLPRELSGGQQQRVALARALAAAPRVVLLDEPFTALDPETVAALRSMLRDRLRETSTTAVLVTHDALDAAVAADRLVVLEGGEVSQDGPVGDVLRSPATAFGAVIAGLDRVPGRVAAGVWTGGAMRVPVARPDGDLTALFRPGAVALEAGPGGGDGARPGHASWRAPIARLEPTIGGVRVQLADPAVAVDVPLTAAAVLEPGAEVTASVPLDTIAWV
ncbi:sulfate/molybdate ABC transporter ATP-binding protein [Microbacterium radiodurans]|uniref:ATP-binding cassette domain-containing protein n=1 Tax=Microbacterium radiodurans TaxID=661398 RepID=A0A5J5IS31_9MICO|nr:ATP-binding cassette domain-containing protein [Microbacterium radiodurans]KAA9085184.1 ATP-binding cassette domain-containing protein [Microbacterium radiodurans]